MKKTKALLSWLFIVGALIFLTFPFNGINSQNAPKQVIYSEFVKAIENREIKSVQMFLASPIDPTPTYVIYGQYKTGQMFKTIIPEQDYHIVERILSIGDIDLKVAGNNYMSKYFLYQLLNLFPLLFLIGLMIYSVKQSKSGGGTGGGFGGSPFGFSKNKPIKPTEANKVTFKDVAGIDEAKQELEEIVDFLRAPEKFQRLGGRIPRGVLLVGDPGNGKTLLARAIAGEANVPFFSIAGSDFVEVFVGVGASRVRKIFENAKRNSPCIIFIDEIDAIGRKRDSSLRGGNDEREQTLNQLLVEMDGFEGNQGVIVIAATNRVDILDPALLRPGRFDRRISVDYPDLNGREKILKVHSKKVPLAHDVDLNTIARGTPGFSGAELANLVNEASLLAARKNKLAVYMSDFEIAKDKVMMGAEHKSYRMTPDEIKLTAYHESGHALIALLSKKTDPIHKVTIVPRGQALGMVMQLPENDKVSVTKLEMLCNIKICMGGRAAEEIFFGSENVTTGAYSDMKQATNTAKKMIMKCGMNEKLGLRTFFISENYLDESDKISQRTAEIMDTEIEKLLKTSYEDVKQTIVKYKDKLEKIANTLLKHETLTGAEVKQIFDGTYIDKQKDVSQSGMNLDDFALGGMPNNENIALTDTKKGISPTGCTNISNISGRKSNEEDYTKENQRNINQVERNANIEPPTSDNISCKPSELNSGSDQNKDNNQEICEGYENNNINTNNKDIGSEDMNRSLDINFDLNNTVKPDTDTMANNNVKKTKDKCIKQAMNFIDSSTVKENRNDMQNHSLNKPSHSLNKPSHSLNKPSDDIENEDMQNNLSSKPSVGIRNKNVSQGKENVRDIDNSQYIVNNQIENRIKNSTDGTSVIKDNSVAKNAPNTKAKTVPHTNEPTTESKDLLIPESEALSATEFEDLLTTESEDLKKKLSKNAESKNQPVQTSRNKNLIERNKTKEEDNDSGGGGK